MRQSSTKVDENGADSQPCDAPEDDGFEVRAPDIQESQILDVLMFLASLEGLPSRRDASPAQRVLNLCASPCGVGSHVATMRVLGT